MVKGMSFTALETLFRKEFNQAVGEYENTNAWDAVAGIGTEIPSTGPVEDYRWLQELPEFEEWIGDMNAADLAEYKFSITNIPFVAKVGVHVDELADDKEDIILTRVRGMAGGDKRKWGKLLHSLLINGETLLAYDGVAFFSNAGAVRLNDNLLAGTVSAGSPTAAQFLADVDTVMQAMGSFVNSRGEIVGIIPDTFVVSTKLASTARSALYSVGDAASSNSAVQNRFTGAGFKVVVDPGLTDLNDFYALATRYSVGGLVKQNRSGLETFLDTTGQYKNGRLEFGAKFRGNVGYGLPIMAAKVVSGVA